MKKLSAALLVANLVFLAAPYAVSAAPADPPTHAALPPAHTAHPAIAVLAVSQLDAAGKANVTSLGKGDAVMFSLAEEAITKSKAFRLYGRDQWKNQADEIKMNAEGWVTPDSAKQFGKAQGVERFVTVFVSSLGEIDTVPMAAVRVPAHGGIARGNGGTGLASIAVSSSKSAADTAATSALATSIASLFGKKRNEGNSEQSEAEATVNAVKATITIICRFTKVETGKRETMSFTGTAWGDATNVSQTQVLSASLVDAFDSFARSLYDTRELLTGNITQIVDGCMIADLGEDEGVTKDMRFEVCERRQIGDFVSYNKVCEARVCETNGTSSMLQTGKMDGFPRQWKRKSEYLKDVRVGYIIRERR